MYIFSFYKGNEMDILKIEEALKENANDFISRSIDAYNKKDNKAALINLWSGVLLLFKIWIFRRHPSMIYSAWEKVIKYNNGELEFSPFISDGNYQTVNFDEIRNRFIFLGNGKSLLFSNEKLLNNIRRKRNRIEHFVHDIKDIEITTVFVKVLPLINDFIEQELDEKVNDFLECWPEFLRIEELFRHRLKKMEDFIDEIRPTYRDIKHGDTDLVEFDCPNCLDGKLVNINEDTFYCRACEYSTKYVECDQCSRVILEDDFDSILEETGICSDCMNDICERND